MLEGKWGGKRRLGKEARVHGTLEGGNMRTEIFGRSKERAHEHGTRGCGYVGKIVSYPGGRYEESGAVFLDLVDPHCTLVLGKRGTGKSYTLGVFLEGFSLLEQAARERMAILVVDTMSVFHSLKTANTQSWEVQRMKDFNTLVPRELDNIRIALPVIAEERLKERGITPYKDISLSIPPSSVSTHSWLQLFDLRASSPIGSLLLSVLRGLEGEWSMNELKEEVRTSHASPEEQRSLLAMVEMAEGTKLFSSPASDLVRPGTITILDISYLGRIGGLDLRAFVVAHLAEAILRERTLQTTVEMQRQAGLLVPGPVPGNAHGSAPGATPETAPENTPDPAHETEGSKDGKPVEMKQRDIPLVWLVIDEAHLFLPSEGMSISSQALIDWIKLGRHPGLSILMATQEPSA
ncbi:MAG: DUF87 domain-containing protein, partial [Thermoplasmata archaeon]|nr:DUF87 domain-containing protein [Thermoplasmata archaeon]